MAMAAPTEGHVLLRLRSGEIIEGFVFDSMFANPKVVRDAYIEVLLKGSGARRRFLIEHIDSIAAQPRSK